MSRWRCCNSEGCTLATATASDWTSSGGYWQWIPTGPFTGQALPTWYVELTFTDLFTPSETWLDLIIDDPYEQIPFSIGVSRVPNQLRLHVNDLVAGFVSPAPVVKRLLIGIANYQLPYSEPRRIHLGVAGFDADDRMVFSIVRPLQSDAQLNLKFVSIRTVESVNNIQTAKLGRMRADTHPCCPDFSLHCLAGINPTPQISQVLTYSGFTEVFDPYGVDVVTNDLTGAGLQLEFCIEACSDPDGFYRVYADFAEGRAYLQWVDCGHSGGVYTVAQSRFSVPLPDPDGYYRFHVCVTMTGYGPTGPGVLVQVGYSKTVLGIGNLPFVEYTNCLRSPFFCEEHFSASVMRLIPHLRRTTHVMVTHYFSFSASAWLGNQRIGCDCRTGYEGPPSPIACHGFTGEEVPAQSVKATLLVDKLPTLSRPADQQNSKVYYPLGFMSGHLPAIGVAHWACWVAGDPLSEFGNAWPRRNQNTNFAFTSLFDLCRMASGVLCWDQYPPPPDAMFDPLRPLAGYSLEWAAYTALAYVLVGETEIRDANEEGWTFLLLRFRTLSQDSPELRFWYCTPTPIPFPLLRPSPYARVPPVPSRTFTLDGSGFAGLVFPVASPGQQAADYVRNALIGNSGLSFTVIYDP